MHQATVNRRANQAWISTLIMPSNKSRYFRLRSP